ncbi:hypothetical protein PVAP13_4NG018881, partial [Panicum virgatum]
HRTSRRPPPRAHEPAAARRHTLRWLRDTICPAFLAVYSRRRPQELQPPAARSSRQSSIVARHRTSSPCLLTALPTLRLAGELRRALGPLVRARGRPPLTSWPPTLTNPPRRRAAPGVCAASRAVHVHRVNQGGETGAATKSRGGARGGARAGAECCRGGDGRGRRRGIPVARLSPVARGSRNPVPSASVALGGVLHWSCHLESGDSGDMVVFDMASERFRRIPPPPLTDPHTHHLRAFDMGGTLAVSTVTLGSPSMDIWALESDGVAWARRLQIDLPPRQIPELQPSDEAQAILEGGLLVLVGAGWVALHDVVAKTAVSRVDYSQEIGNVCRCLYRTSLAPLPRPRAQPPRHCLGDKPSLHY